MSASYPTRSRRTALVPSLLVVVALLVGVALITSDGFVVIRYIVSIFALIVSVFAWQARQWWWLPLLAAIAVLFNPVVVVPITGDPLLIAHYVSIIVLLAIGILVKVRNPEDRNRRPANG